MNVLLEINLVKEILNCPGRYVWELKEREGERERERERERD